MAAQSNITTTSFAAAMKEIHPQKKVDLLYYDDHPFAARIAKKDDFVGKDGGMNIVVQTGVPQGNAHTFANAQANKSTGREDKFLINRRTDYGVWEIENEVIAATRNDRGALMGVLKNKGDHAVKGLGRSFARQLWNNGGGALAAIGSKSTDTITLANAADIVFFERDRVLNANTTDGTTAGTTRAGTGIIIGVNRAAGTIQLSATVPAAWVATDFLFRDGDLAAGLGLAITGVPGWIPTTAPTSGDSFFGLDRSVDATRLAGIVTAARGTVAESLKHLITEIKKNGGKVTHAWLNPDDWELMELQLENRVQSTQEVFKVNGKRSAEVGFEVLRIRTQSGVVMVHSDVNVPQGFGWALDMSTWTFHHLEGLPHRITRGMGEGGGRASSTADSVEFRAVWRGNLACVAPGHNGVTAL